MTFKDRNRRHDDASDSLDVDQVAGSVAHSDPRRFQAIEEDIGPRSRQLRPDLLAVYRAWYPDGSVAARQLAALATRVGRIGIAAVQVGWLPWRRGFSRAASNLQRYARAPQFCAPAQSAVPIRLVNWFMSK